MGLREERRKTGKTQKALSDGSGVNIRMVQYYEQGVKDINKAQTATLCKLALELGVPIYKLVTDKKLIDLLKKEREL